MSGDDRPPWLSRLHDTLASALELGSLEGYVLATWRPEDRLQLKSDGRSGVPRRAARRLARWISHQPSSRRSRPVPHFVSEPGLHGTRLVARKLPEELLLLEVGVEAPGTGSFRLEGYAVLDEDEARGLRAAIDAFLGEEG